MFRDGDEIFIQSRDEKPLNRYFPELIEPLHGAAARRAACSTARSSSREDGALDFDALQLRLHPAASRVKMLSQEIPASVVFFDLLCEGDAICASEPFAERRATLEALLAKRRRRCT